MANFIVTYDLNNKKDYEPLWEAFKALGGFKALRSVYLVDYDTTAQGLLDYLAQFIDGDDYLFVAEMGDKPAKLRCFQGTKAWIDARF